MSPRISLDQERVLLDDPAAKLTGRHVSMLVFWGFKLQTAPRRFTATPSDQHALLDKVIGYFDKHGVAYEVSPEVTAKQTELAGRRSTLEEARGFGAAFKQGNIKAATPVPFLDFLTKKIRRKLKPHQIKAALHLLGVKHGANFSVPGSGKTSVVLAVYQWLREQDLVDSLFVVGPPSCFAPWKMEFLEVIGREPAATVLAGGSVADRRMAYNTNRRMLRELYLTSFQTLQRDWEFARQLFTESGARFFLVIDEAHYIKQLDGSWAGAVLNLAPHATRRCILTGTPFPRTYSDAFNLFDALWPASAPLSPKDRIRIEYHAQKRHDQEASTILGASIGPLFYRVRKQDLGLADQKFHKPILVPMGRYEQQVYDSILDRIRDVSKEDQFRNWDLLIRLRRGRMVRLRQTISYTRLLSTAVDEYSENLLDKNPSLAEVIRHYDALEVPGKLTKLAAMIADFRKRGEKVLIWSNFVETLRLITNHLSAQGHGTRLIYGATPTEATSEEDEETREKIIQSFLDRKSGINVLVANPAACAESISLHKACAHAIYYDLSYNCAQYLQSLDRIHRVGGSEEQEANYYFLQYGGTMDNDVLANVQKKATAMSAIIDRDYPIYDLNMFSADEEIAAYERLFT